MRALPSLNTPTSLGSVNVIYGETEKKNVGWERENLEGKGEEGEQWPRKGKWRQTDRQRTVSPFVGKGSLHSNGTQFSCAGCLIPMNLQLNAEVADKRQAKRRYY